MYLHYDFKIPFWSSIKYKSIDLFLGDSRYIYQIAVGAVIEIPPVLTQEDIF